MSAVLSPCGAYRYRLDRELAPKAPSAVVIMINPSTADAVEDDATIRKLKGFGRRYGWGRFTVGNLFAFRTKDVRKLKLVDDPVGRDNDMHLQHMMRQADVVVVAWGPLAKQPKQLRERYSRIMHLSRCAGRELFSIGPPAKDGHPKHPLMLPYSLALEPWKDPAS